MLLSTEQQLSSSFAFEWLMYFLLSWQAQNAITSIPRTWARMVPRCWQPETHSQTMAPARSSWRVGWPRNWQLLFVIQVYLHYCGTMLARLLDGCRMGRWSRARFIKSTGGGKGDDGHCVSTTASHPVQAFTFRRGAWYSTYIAQGKTGKIEIMIIAQLSQIIPPHLFTYLGSSIPLSKDLGFHKSINRCSALTLLFLVLTIK